jgi:hypothetical protein
MLPVDLCRLRHYDLIADFGRLEPDEIGFVGYRNRAACSAATNGACFIMRIPYM